ncbi:hypothetical protein HHI36_023051 [Cryptolaemus montrouzieri]|uniref:Uncharacterized protein n=1 Tax=Cryptolaemus montrouzieri TaxID=559131 RepID=A0ABD2PFB5_9CUCU
MVEGQRDSRTGRKIGRLFAFTEEEERRFIAHAIAVPIRRTFDLRKVMVRTSKQTAPMGTCFLSGTRARRPRDIEDMWKAGRHNIGTRTFHNVSDSSVTYWKRTFFIPLGSKCWRPSDDLQHRLIGNGRSLYHLVPNAGDLAMICRAG